MTQRLLPPSRLGSLVRNSIHLVTFTFLLCVYLVHTYLIAKALHNRHVPLSLRTRLEPFFEQLYRRLLKIFDKQTGSISRVDLIELSLRNMRTKKTRTMVTVGGMAIGIGAIVFLVSVGYGLQQLVISRVVRLDEMRQADVYPQAGSQVNINDKTLQSFKEIPNVQLVLPLIAVVGRVNYQNSVSDMAVYGVTADYLKQSATKLIQGHIFESNTVSMIFPQGADEVVPRDGRSTNVLGETSVQSGNGNVVSPGFVTIASESGTVQDLATKKVSLPIGTERKAIINRAMAQVLGIREFEAVGKTFTASFVVVGDLLADNNDRVESNPASYTIVGVTPDEKTPFFYVPFTDMRSLGVVNFSQVKVVTKDQKDLAFVRRQIEAQGYLTRSVVDTVSQINSLFGTIRAILALLGTVALAVAALGMFNTLTVSLLERTREVGLMKAMGMKSSEVKELFLTESMIMGLFGGLLGIFFGFVFGKGLGLILSIFSLAKGVGFVDVAYLPIPFVLLVVGLSVIVGVMTGFYPARRATKISALNALRYE